MRQNNTVHLAGKKVKEGRTVLRRSVGGELISLSSVVEPAGG